MARARVPGLSTLARMYGVQTAFYDVEGRRQQAPPEAVLLVLKALGAPVETFADVSDALRERRRELWARAVEPVTVAWDGRPVGIALRLPATSAEGTVRCHLAPESGEARNWTSDVGELPVVESAFVDGVRYQARRLSLPFPLPWGYHRLALECGGKQFEMMVISAPPKADAFQEERASKCWGVFMPLYALHSRRSWGAGDLADSQSLLEWVAGLGGSAVATLPLLAAFLDEPLEPSPYAPVSRLFWNEFYIDVTCVPELQRCPSAQAIGASPEVQQVVEALRSLPLVDYRRGMALKRRVLEELARCFFAERSERYAAFARFLEAHPSLEDYARFRATVERRRSPWPAWPQPLRDGVLKAGDYDEGAKHYHLYVQWVAQEQMQALYERGRAAGVKLCLDLPLGVHPDGYDVWRERDVFALRATAGSPPDTFFTKGQDWGFSPLHPEALRKQGYRYSIDCLRHHLQHAGILRLDHIMSLHHLYWIPRGTEARDGVYVRYPWDELYAILSVESHRHEALIVGEDLGTVPRYVRKAMARHNIHRIYVVQFELRPERRRPVGTVPAASVASVNTHDMPPFAAFWRGLDIDDRLKRGLLDDKGARSERRARHLLKQSLLALLKRRRLLKGANPDERGILRACLAFLAASRARVVLVGLEDLWLETEPQNVPGTWDEHPNWRKKAVHSVEAFCQMPQVLGILSEMNRRRPCGGGLQ
ncbi:MAG: 4-alpha-glucanotransferase [Dehalococcoidia bacterium SM23_28_1]|nr:MAG: 4-alpha-glucanotransferase [Dehalococcoidia bacterium SM23_28_1]